MRWAPIRAADGILAGVGGRGFGSLATPFRGGPEFAFPHASAEVFRLHSLQTNNLLLVLLLLLLQLPRLLPLLMLLLLLASTS